MPRKKRSNSLFSRWTKPVCLLVLGALLGYACSPGFRKESSLAFQVVRLTRQVADQRTVIEFSESRIFQLTLEGIAYKQIAEELMTELEQLLPPELPQGTEL